MALGDVCIHWAWTITTADSTDEDTWVEGEPDEEPVEGAKFECFFMDPGERETNSPVSSKKITQPTLLLEACREDETPVVLKAEDELMVEAPEILGDDPVRFQVDGGPTPLAPPGELIGYEVRLKRVRGS